MSLLQNNIENYDLSVSNAKYSLILFYMSFVCYWYVIGICSYVISYVICMCSYVSCMSIQFNIILHAICMLFVCTHM